ncbi:hypothetical protein [Pseudolactococcus hodotermopsidis]|nr:hypothetical protein [Lactococcus hodotermopsidis]
MTLMQKLQKLMAEKKSFRFIVKASAAQSWREYFISENSYHSSDIVEIGDNYVIITKQDKQLLLPEWRISAIILL